jgi:hypothetical protein
MARNWPELVMSVKKLWVKDGEEWRQVQQCWKSVNGQWLPMSFDEVKQYMEDRQRTWKAVWAFVAAASFLAFIAKIVA